MTGKQRITLMADWWPRAVATQKWNRGDRELRMRVLSEAVGRPLQSANDLNDTSDVDAVKRHLLTLADSLPAAMEEQHQARARRVQHEIGDVMQCLALYMEDVPAYAREIIRDKVCRGRKFGNPIPEIADLSTAPRFFTRPSDDKLIELPSELDQLLMTLTRALNGKNGYRNQAGHSLHDMRTMAGLECYCAPCCKSRRAAQAPRFGPAEYATKEEPF